MRSPKPKRLTNQKEVDEAARLFLDKRGLTLKDGDFTPVTPAALAKANLNLPRQDLAGMVISYHDVKGAETDFYRYRFLEQPQVSGFAKLTARKQAEYRYSQPDGTPARAYFPLKFNFSHFFALPACDRALTITEGEFKADAAAKHDIACIALGGVSNYLVEVISPPADNSKKKEKTKALLPELKRLPWQGMDVHLCYDSDAATNTEVLRARDGLAEWLEALGARIFIRSLPPLERGAKTGLDDYLRHKKGGKQNFLALPLERWYGPNVPRLESRAKDDFLKHKYAEREEILKSDAAVLLRHPSIVQIHAFRGVGKTHVAGYLAGALTHKGGQFFRWNTVRPLRVLYVDGEQLGQDGQEVVRLQAAAAPSENLRYLTLEDQPTFRIPKIVTPEGQRALEREIEEHRIEVVFLDSLSTLANVAMNDEENQLALGDWFVRLRTGLRVTVVYLQHDGKTGQQRGHSKHEDWIDLSIHLKWPPEYHGAEGLRAHFSFDKARRPISDGRNMKISFGPSLKDPRRSEWHFVELTKEEETDGDMLTAATLLLFRDPKMSDTKLSTALREKGFKAKNDKFRKLIQQAREIRAKSDAPGGKKQKF